VATDQEELAVPSPGPARGRTGGESPAVPRIPSFESLRAPRRRTAVDILTAEPRLAPVAAPGPVPVAVAVAAAGPVGGEGPVAPRTPRPAEYADLLPFALRVASAVVGVPVRLTRWSITEPVRCFRRLLGQ
jgi:hypothetical protein